MAVIATKKSTQSITKPKSKPVKQQQEMVIRSRFVRQPPDKIRLLCRLIKGKKITDALNILQFAHKAAAKPLILVIKEAKARGKENIEQEFFIKSLAIDEGPKLKRRRIIHRGRATTILKRMSHITIVLSDNVNPPTTRGVQSKTRNPKQITNKQNPKLRK